MQEFFERKKEAPKQEEKKQPLTHKSLSLSMSEGPMMLAEGGKIEAAGRASFEKSVKVELDAIKARIAVKLAGKKKTKKKKGKKSREKKDGK